MKRLLMAALVATTALTAPAVLAQNAGAAQPAAKSDSGAVDAAAAKLLADSTAAVKKIRDVSATTTQSVGPMTSKGAFVVSIPEKIAGFPFSMYSFTLHNDEGKPTAQWSTDGKQVQKLDHAGKVLLTFKNDKGEALAMPPQDVWPVMPQWIFEDIFENPQLKLVAAKVLPDADVAGVKCRVVEVTREFDPGQEDSPKLTMKGVRYIGAEDNLPRRIEMSMDNPDPASGGQGYSMKVEMADMKVNQGLKGGDYAIKAPAGYESKDASASDVGVQLQADQPQLAVKEGSEFPAFTLKDPSGKEVTLASLKGRVVLLDFWATWCGPCKAVMPKIQELHEKFKDKAVTIAGVNCWEEKPENAVKYMESKKYTYSLLLGGDDLAKSLNITGIPTLILIGKDGKVLHTTVGVSPGEEETLAKIIEEQLAAK